MMRLKTATIWLLLSTPLFAADVFDDVFLNSTNVFDEVFDDGTSVDIADMETLTLRRVFEEETWSLNDLSPAGIEAAIEALTPNAELLAYDFSGCSLCTDRSNTNADEVTIAIPTTMITARHGLASDHSGPAVGNVVWFREPDGDAVSGTVQAVTEVPNVGGEIRLVRFAANPSASLQRYSVATNVDFYGGGQMWGLRPELNLLLKEVTGYYANAIGFGASTWGIQSVASASGRPCLVPLTNGEMLLIGNFWSADSIYSGGYLSNPDSATTEINTLLSSYSETVPTMDLPGVDTELPPIPPPDTIETNGRVHGRLRLRTRQ